MTAQTDERVGYLPTLPEGLIEGLIDTGRWRDLGITHWHLWSHESAVSNPARTAKEHIAARIASGRPEFDPKVALEWVFTQHLTGLYQESRPERCAIQRGWRDEPAFRASIELSWEFMTDKAGALTPIGGGLEIRPGWSLDVYAEPMTKAHCLRH